jgi:hypothetical protein
VADRIARGLDSSVYHVNGALISTFERACLPSIQGNVSLQLESWAHPTDEGACLHSSYPAIAQLFAGVSRRVGQWRAHGQANLASSWEPQQRNRDPETAAAGFRPSSNDLDLPPSTYHHDRDLRANRLLQRQRLIVPAVATSPDPPSRAIEASIEESLPTNKRPS